jgi:hypothetical protein
LTSGAEIQIVERNFWPDLTQQARRQGRTDQGNQQPKQVGQQNDSAFEQFGQIESGVGFRQPVQSPVSFDMQRAQPGNVGAGQHERAREKGPKAAISQQRRQMRTQLVGKVNRRRGFCLGSLMPQRLINHEIIGELPHLRRGSVVAPTKDSLNKS